MEWADGAWAWLTESAIPQAADRVKEFAAAVAEGVANAWPDVWAALKAWGESSWDWLTEIAIPAAGEKVNELVSAVTSEIEAAWPDVEASLKKWGENFWSWLTGTKFISGQSIHTRRR